MTQSAVRSTNQTCRAGRCQWDESLWFTLVHSGSLFFLALGHDDGPKVAARGARVAIDVQQVDVSAGRARHFDINEVILLLDRKRRVRRTGAGAGSADR